MGNQVPMYPAATTFSNDDIFYKVEGGEQGVPDQGTSKSITGAILRKFLGVQETPWDVSGSVSDAIPVLLKEVTATAIPATKNYNLAPTAGGFTIKGALSGNVVPGGIQWGSFEVPAHDPGDTTLGVAYTLTNVEATHLDLQSSFNSFPTLVGTVDWVILITEQGGALITYYITQAGGIIGSITMASVSAGDLISIGFDADTNKLLRQVNAGTIAEYTVPDPITTFKIFASFQNTAEPPVFLAGNWVVSFGTDAGGRTPFQAGADATPPVGATDGMKFLVANEGIFNGKQLANGDIAEFFNNMTDVVVVPGSPMTATMVSDIANAAITASQPGTFALLAPYIARGIGRIRDVRSIPIGGATDFTCDIVATSPSGGFLGFTPGSLAVHYDGTWYEVPRSQLLGCTFVFEQALTYSAQAEEFKPMMLHCLDAAGLATYSYSPYVSNQGQGVPDYLNSTTTEAELRQLGWILDVPAGSPGLRKCFSQPLTSTGYIEPGDAQYHEFEIQDDFTLTINLSGTFPNASRFMVRVKNIAGTSKNFAFNGVGSPMAISAGAAKVFECLYDVSSSVAFINEITPIA